MVPKSDNRKNVGKVNKRITRLDQQKKIAKAEKRTTRSDKQKHVAKVKKRTIPHINFYPEVCIHVIFFSVHFNLNMFTILYCVNNFCVGLFAIKKC